MWQSRWLDYNSNQSSTQGNRTQQPFELGAEWEIPPRPPEAPASEKEEFPAPSAIHRVAEEAAAPWASDENGTAAPSGVVLVGLPPPPRPAARVGVGSASGARTDLIFLRRFQRRCIRRLRVGLGAWG